MVVGGDPVAEFGLLGLPLDRVQPDRTDRSRVRDDQEGDGVVATDDVLEERLLPGVVDRPRAADWPPDSGIVDPTFAVREVVLLDGAQVDLLAGAEHRLDN